MQYIPLAQSNNNWIMVYQVFQDHLTKFCMVLLSMTKGTAEVVFQLMDIFISMRAPARNDNGSEFTEMKGVRSNLVFLHGNHVILKAKVL